MNLRSLLPAVLVFAPLGLEADEGTSRAWLEVDEFSAEQLDSEYERAIANQVTSTNNGFLDRLMYGAGSQMMIPIMFLAAQDEVVVPPTAPEKIEPAAVESPEEMRIKQLEMENAALKERLSRSEPFVDPDWPAVKERPRKRRLRFRPRPVPPAALARPIHPPLLAASGPPARFRPFTRAAMDTQMSGPLSRARGQSLQEQNRFFWNASKALGAGVASREYRGVRLEVQRAMLLGELNAYYAVQYLSDVVDVFRTYERLKRFHLTDGVAPPVTADSFRRNPDSMFVWASVVNEQKRMLDREDSDVQ